MNIQSTDSGNTHSSPLTNQILTGASEPPRSKPTETPSTESVNRQGTSEYMGNVSSSLKQTVDVGVSSKGTAVSLLPSINANSQAVQTALKVQEAQLANTTENVDQESLESSTQPNTDRIRPGGLIIPLVSSIDAEFQATMTASESQKTRPMDTDDTIVAGQDKPSPSPQRAPGMLQGTSEERLSTETAADDLTFSRFLPFVNVETHQPSFFYTAIRICG